MDELERLYGRLLQVGFIVMGQAADSGNLDWLRAEIELLHNVPSLLCETNNKRHEYFWNGERPHYLDWLSEHGNEDAKARMRTFYLPIWNEMEPIIMQRCCVSEHS